jgi:hypothetical protein
MTAQKGMANQVTRNRIPSGYEGNNIPTDFYIPPVGLYDVDRAMFDLFDRDHVISIESRDEDADHLRRMKVPVVFAAGERFALRERKVPIRDKSGALKLPIISIRRTGINQAKEQMGSAIGQDTGDLVIKKRISPEDPLYQNLLNQRGITSQENVAAVSNFLNQTTQRGNIPGRVASRRDKGTVFG